MGPQYTRTETERATTPYYTEGRRGSPWLHEVAPAPHTAHPSPVRLQATRELKHTGSTSGASISCASYAALMCIAKTLTIKGLMRGGSQERTTNCHLSTNDQRSAGLLRSTHRLYVFVAASSLVLVAGSTSWQRSQARLVSSSQRSGPASAIGQSGLVLVPQPASQQYLASCEFGGAAPP